MMRVTVVAALFVFSVAVWAAEPNPGRTLQDCVDCPVMVVVPPGASLVGSTIEEDIAEMVPARFAASEKPPHAVTIAKPFALGRDEITRGQFATYLKASGAAAPTGGCMAWDKDTQKWGRAPRNDWMNPGFQQDEDHPVVCVSWTDAKGYVDWLAKVTAKPYRLASEAEWEYAARAGTATVRDWGDERDVACTRANVYDTEAAAFMRTKPGPNENFQCQDPYMFTSPMGAFPANGFGLRDMLGNAWEWMDDCYADTYIGAPADGRARLDGDCTKRVGRGGSWGAEPWALRIAHRRGNAVDFKFSSLGFRVARDLN